MCEVVHVVALLPVKSFAAAKARLRGALSDEERARLAAWMATGVVEAVSAMPTFVACDDDEVAAWADRLGARVLWGPGLGLNGAVDDGVARIAALGAEHVLIAHADLPRPAALPSVPRPGCITLVPDRRSDGTNVLSFPLDRTIHAAYGGGSFTAHLRQADARGDVVVEVRRDVDLSLDLDTIEDLHHPRIAEVLPTWLRTNQANLPSPR